MKPIILICGAPHSYTSMISNLLLENGGYCDDTWDNPAFDMSYSRFEGKEIQDFVNKRSQFDKKDLTGYFKSLPEDKIITLKSPRLIFFINELQDFTSREIKVIYVFRNPRGIIASSMEKSGKSFIYHFERLCWLYDFMVDCKFPVYTVAAERILQRDKTAVAGLLNYCGLDSSNINFNSIDPLKAKPRSVKFIQYRFMNFIWKRLTFLFNIK